MKLNEKGAYKRAGARQNAIYFSAHSFKMATRREFFITLHLCYAHTHIYTSCASTCTSVFCHVCAMSAVSFQATMDAAAGVRTSARSRNPRRTLQLTFSSTEAKEAFNNKLEALKVAFVPNCSTAELLVKLFELADAHLASR